MVEVDETGEQLYFRFYDPVCLVTFWRTCTNRQKLLMQGEVINYIVENEGLILYLKAAEPRESA
jgi:hypothetical protein